MKTPELAYEKNLKELALRADLNSPQAVELAIARYKKRIARANSRRKSTSKHQNAEDVLSAKRNSQY